MGYTRCVQIILSSTTGMERTFELLLVAYERGPATMACKIGASGGWIMRKKMAYTPANYDSAMVVRSHSALALVVDVRL